MWKLHTSTLVNLRYYSYTQYYDRTNYRQTDIQTDMLLVFLVHPRSPLHDGIVNNNNPSGCSEKEKPYSVKE